MIVLQEEMIQKMQNLKDNDMKGLSFGRDWDNKGNNDDIVDNDSSAAFDTDYGDDDDKDDDSNSNSNSNKKDYIYQLIQEEIRSAFRDVT